MATGTLHPGKQSLLDIVRIPQDDKKHYKVALSKKQVQFWKFLLIFQLHKA